MTDLSYSHYAIKPVHDGGEYEYCIYDYNEKQTIGYIGRNGNNHWIGYPREGNDAIEFHCGTPFTNPFLLINTLIRRYESTAFDPDIIRAVAALVDDDWEEFVSRVKKERMKL